MKRLYFIIVLLAISTLVGCNMPRQRSQIEGTVADIQIMRGYGAVDEVDIILTNGNIVIIPSRKAYLRSPVKVFIGRTYIFHFIKTGGIDKLDYIEEIK